MKNLQQPKKMETDRRKSKFEKKLGQQILTEDFKPIFKPVSLIKQQQKAFKPGILRK